MELFSINKDIDEIFTTDEAKVSYLKGLARVSIADGEIDLSESKYFHEIALDIGLSPSLIEEIESSWNSYGSARISFNSKKEKVYFLMQAFFLAWADSNLSNEELDEIQTIAYEIDIDDITLKKVENWVHSGIEWLNNGSDLLSID